MFLAATCFSRAADKSSWNWLRVVPWINSFAPYLAPSFWQAAFIAGSITLSRTRSTDPMFATMFGAPEAGCARRPASLRHGASYVELGMVWGMGRIGKFEVWSVLAC